MCIQRTLTASLLTTALLASCAPSEEGLSLAKSDEETYEVIGGWQDDSFGAVGYLIRDGVGPHCAGTLIAPRMVVTAAHCLAEGTQWQVSFGRVDSGTKYDVIAEHPHPDYAGPTAAGTGLHDVAVLELREGPSSITPATIAVANPHDTHRFIGYGRVLAGDRDVVGGYTGERKGTYQQITRLDGVRFFASDGSSALCWGDSGGPLFVEGTTTIVGVLSGFPTPPHSCEVQREMAFSSLHAELEFLHPFLSGDSDGPTTCELACARYEYTEGQCRDGWHCREGCLYQEACPPPPPPGCTYTCGDYEFVEGQCRDGWRCEDGCLHRETCPPPPPPVCDYYCSDYGYADGECRDGWRCARGCITLGDPC